jgi:hypothetical protein
MADPCYKESLQCEQHAAYSVFLFDALRAFDAQQWQLPLR